jgi:metal-responsive CopG/Arc/MetJ family transcriptional regulator
MRITLSIPEPVARKFRTAVPARKRSQLVTRLIEAELAREESHLANACLEANADGCLNGEIDEWQAFEEGA